MQNVTILWLVFECTGSSAKLGLFTLLTTLPGIILTLLAGPIIDRIDRWWLLRIIMGLSIIPPFILGLIVQFGSINLYLFGFLAMLSHLLAAVDMPLRQVCISSIVQTSLLTQALSLQALSFHTSRMVGSSLGGFFLTIFPSGLNFFLNALSYLPFLLFTFKISPREKRLIVVKNRSLREDFRELFQFLSRQRKVSALLVQVTLFSFFGVAVPIIFPKLAVESLSGKAFDFGLLSSLLGFGAMAGALSLSLGRQESSDDERRLWQTKLLFSLSLILLGLSSGEPFILLSVFLMGFSFTNFFPIINSRLQQETPENLRGRVMGTFTFAFTGTVPVGQFFCGSLADILGIRALSLSLSLCIIISSYIFKGSKS